MAIIDVEAHVKGSSEAQAAVVRQFNVMVVMRGTAANSSAGRPKPEPKPREQV